MSAPQLFKSNKTENRNKENIEIKTFKKTDIGFIAILVILYIVFIIVRLISSKDTEKANLMLMTDNNTSAISLKDNGTKSIVTVVENFEYKITLEIEDNKARFRTSNCSDQLCVKSGWIKNSGETIACLPAKTSIKIDGAKSSSEDIIAR